MFDLQKLKRAHRAFEARHAAMVDAALAEGGKEGVREASGAGKRHRDRTGDLSRANEYQIIRTRGGHLLRLRNRKPYAAAIDKGSRPHPIMARRAPLLVFYWAKTGKWMFLRRVNHPGNKPYRFLWRGMGKAQRHAAMLMRRGAKQIASKF